MNLEISEKENSISNEGFENLRHLLMYYQTSIRNVALTTAVSFAALGYSRFYRERSLLYSVGLVIVSLLLIVNSFLLNIYLYNSLEKYISKDEFKELEKWKNVNHSFFLIHAILILFALYTLFRLVTDSKF